MITLIGSLERGHPARFEHGCWKQLSGAWGARLVLVGHDFETMEEALDSYDGPRVFFIPPGRVPSISLEAYTPPETAAFVFGRPGDNLVRYMRKDEIVVSIHTPGQADMMAVSAAGIVMYVYG